VLAESIVAGLGVSSSLVAAVAQWVYLPFDPQPKMARVSSPNQRVIVARSDIAKVACAVCSTDHRIGRQRNSTKGAILPFSASAFG
jgi:hypothetical protein